jgi:hypothetical protein
MLELLTNAAVAMRPNATVSVMLDFARSFMIQFHTRRRKVRCLKAAIMARAYRWNCGKCR